MAGYAWTGRARNGASVRGVIEAPSREAALAQLKASGVLATSVAESEGPGQDLAPAPPAELPDRAEAARRAARSDSAFFIAVMLVSTAISLAVPWIDPVLTYDCRRDAAGAVSCSIDRHVYGLVPLSTVQATRILSASVKYSTASETMAERSRRLRSGGSLQESETLVLVCASGPCWSSRSAWPMGDTNDDIERGIADLLAAGEPKQFEAWQAEKVTLSVAAAFLAPLAFVLLGLVLRVVGGEWLKRKLQDLAAEMSRRQGRPLR